MELVNVDESVMLFAEALLCGDISTPITGQIALNVMADPPKPGDPSHCLYKQVLKCIEQCLFYVHYIVCVYACVYVCVAGSGIQAKHTEA